MPHLSPMAWILFLISLWGVMILSITNTWWFMSKPMSPVNKKIMMSFNSLNWKW